MTHLWRMVRLLPAYRTRTAAIVGTSAAIGFIGMATPFVFREVVNLLAHRAGMAQEALVRGMGLALAAFVATRLLLVWLGALQHQQSAALWLDNVGSLRKRVFDDMSTLPLRYYETARVGDIMDRFGAIVPVTLWLRDLVEGALASAVQLVFSLAVLLLVSPEAGAVMLAAAPLNLWIAWKSLRATRPHRQAWQRLGGRMSALLSEMMSQITTVRAFGGEDQVRRRFGAAHASGGEARIREWRIDRRWATLLLAVNGLALSLVTAILVRGGLSGRYSLGDVMLVWSLAQGVVLVIGPISRSINAAGEAESSAERLSELLNLTPGAATEDGGAALDEIRSIAFENVSFAYPGVAAPVLQDVSFRLSPGRALALVGPSGSGKSSLVKLMLRLYEPTAGRILVNDRPIGDFSLASLRARIGIVLQDVALFNDTIARNIAFAREDARPDEIAAAARLAHADDFIRRLPEGYETDVGERGVKLSGGERQRISVARAILRDPDLVILDEATSALDSEAERLVQAGLDSLMARRTAIVIAHRLSTIRGADEICVLQAGRIVERGRHADLVVLNGLYAQLHALQAGPERVALAS
jgi:ABC-type multidrug transport system fused ATPase/permease subunit